MEGGAGEDDGLAGAHGSQHAEVADGEELRAAEVRFEADGAFAADTLFLGQREDGRGDRGAAGWVELHLQVHEYEYVLGLFISGLDVLIGGTHWALSRESSDLSDINLFLYT